MFKSMKLSTKLIGGFVVVAVITLIVGFIGWKGISDVFADLTEINDVRLPSITALGTIKESKMAIHKTERTLLIPEFFQNETEKTRQIKALVVAWEKVDKEFKTFEGLSHTRDEKATWEQFKPAWQA
jgi:methyl-accepting chemotaxis protein